MAEVTLRQLERFRAIAEHGSLRDAAAALRVSESAMAVALDQLEAALGLQLCVRRRALGVALTPDGRRIAELADRLLEEADAFRAGAADLAGAIGGRVALGCANGLAPTLLPPVLARVRAEYPAIELRLVTGATEELLPRLRRGELDLLVLPGGGVPAGLAAAPLYETAIHALLAADDPLAASDPVPLADLAGAPLILLDVEESAAHVVDLFAPLGLAPTIEIRTTNFELVRSLVARGFGYSLQLQRPWGDHSYEGLPLVARRTAPAPERDVVRLAWPESVALTSRVRAVVDVARAAFA